MLAKGRAAKHLLSLNDLEKCHKMNIDSLRLANKSQANRGQLIFTLNSQIVVDPSSERQSYDSNKRTSSGKHIQVGMTAATPIQVRNNRQSQASEYAFGDHSRECLNLTPSEGKVSFIINKRVLLSDRFNTLDRCTKAKIKGRNLYTTSDLSRSINQTALSSPAHTSNMSTVKKCIYIAEIGQSFNGINSSEKNKTSRVINFKSKSIHIANRCAKSLKLIAGSQVTLSPLNRGQDKEDRSLKSADRPRVHGMYKSIIKRNYTPLNHTPVIFDKLEKIPNPGLEFAKRQNMLWPPGYLKPPSVILNSRDITH